MEEHPIPEQPEEQPAEQPAERPLSLSDVEAQLTALSQHLSAEIAALAQADTARREDLDARENDLRRRELSARAHDLLKERGLPTALSGVLSFADEDALAAEVDALEQAFRAAVQSGVEARLLTAAPKAAPLKAPSDMTDEEYYAVVSRT